MIQVGQMMLLKNKEWSESYLVQALESPIHGICTVHIIESVPSGRWHVTNYAARTEDLYDLIDHPNEILKRML